VQNIQNFRWDYERVVVELEKSMKRAYQDVSELAKRYEVDLRTASFMLGVHRVREAAFARQYSHSVTGSHPREFR